MFLVFRETPHCWFKIPALLVGLPALLVGVGGPGPTNIFCEHLPEPRLGQDTSFTWGPATEDHPPKVADEEDILAIITLPLVDGAAH